MGRSGARLGGELHVLEGAPLQAAGNAAPAPVVFWTAAGPSLAMEAQGNDVGLCTYTKQTGPASLSLSLLLCLSLPFPLLPPLSLSLSRSLSLPPSPSLPLELTHTQTSTSHAQPVLEPPSNDMA